MDSIASVAVIAAMLIVGLLVGWWLGGRGSAAMRAERAQAKGDAEGWRA